MAIDDPPRTPNEIAQARSLLDLRRPDEALTILQKATNRDVYDEEAWCLVSRAFLQLNDLNRSVKAAELALATHPTCVPGHFHYCDAMIRSTDHARALELTRKSVVVTGGEPEIRRLLIRSLIHNKLYSEAAAEVQQLQSTAPDLDLSYERGELALGNAECHAAKREFSAAVSRNKDFEKAWAALAKALSVCNEPFEAMLAAYEAARLSPLEPEYRRGFFSFAEEILEKRTDTPRTVYVILVASICFFTFLAWRSFLVLLLIIAGHYGWKAVYGWFEARLLSELPTPVRAYYRELKPLQAREETLNLRWGCGLLVIMIVAAVELTRRGWWEPLLRLLFVGGLTWMAVWLNRPASPKTESEVTFRFPDEKPGEEILAGEPSFALPVDLAMEQLRTAKLRDARKTVSRAIAEAEEAGLLAILALIELAEGDYRSARETAVRARTAAPESLEAIAVAWLEAAVACRWEDVRLEARRNPTLESTVLEQLRVFQTVLRAASRAGAASAGIAVNAATELARALDPSSLTYQLMLGDQAWTEERYEDAEAIYRSVLTRNPDSVPALSALGILLYARGRKREARQQFAQALRREPGCRNAWIYFIGTAQQISMRTCAAIAVSLALMCALPTWLGQEPNYWMPTGVLAIPIICGALSRPIYRLALRQLGATLPVGATNIPNDLDVGQSASASMFAALIVLAVHAFQSWLEIALHPTLLPSRWQGAATITYLALFVLILMGVPMYRSYCRDAHS